LFAKIGAQDSKNENIQTQKVPDNLKKSEDSQAAANSSRSSQSGYGLFSKVVGGVYNFLGGSGKNSARTMTGPQPIMNSSD